MDQIAEATHGLEGESENNTDTGRLACSLSASASSLFQGPVASTPRDPFTDSHAISTLTDVSVNDLDQVEMSTFTNEDTGGQS
jgi:hypothetical protein